MRKIVDGKTLNTKAAREIGSAEPATVDKSDFNYFRETLYQSRTGQYFIYGEGHANSPYGVWRGRTGSWGEKIYPINYDEAKQWIEEHLPAEVYESEFGAEEFDDDKEPLSLTISADTKRELIRMRAESGNSISFIVDSILNAYFKQKREEQ